MLIDYSVTYYLRQENKIEVQLTQLIRFIEITERLAEDGDDSDLSETSSEEDFETDIETMSSRPDLATKKLSSCCNCLMRLLPVAEAVRDSSSKMKKHSPLVDEVRVPGKIENASGKFVNVLGSVKFDYFSSRLQKRYPNAEPITLDLFARANNNRVRRYQKIRKKGTSPLNAVEVGYHLGQLNFALDWMDARPSTPSTINDVESSPPNITRLHQQDAVTVVSTCSPPQARMPPLPTEVLLGRPFDCKICFQFISYVRSEADWK